MGFEINVSGLQPAPSVGKALSSKWREFIQISWISKYITKRRHIKCIAIPYATIFLLYPEQNLNMNNKNLGKGQRMKTLFKILVPVFSMLFIFNPINSYSEMKSQNFDNSAEYPTFNDRNGFFVGGPGVYVNHLSSGCHSGRCIEINHTSGGEAWCGYQIDLQNSVNYFKCEYYLKIYENHSTNDLKWMRLYEDYFSGNNWMIKIKSPQGGGLRFVPEMLSYTGEFRGIFNWESDLGVWHKVNVELDNRNPSNKTFKIWVDGELDLNLSGTNSNNVRTIQFAYYSLSAGSLPVHYAMDTFRFTTDPNENDFTIGPAEPGIPINLRIAQSLP